MRALLIQANQAAADNLARLLIQDGWTVDPADTCSEGLQMARLCDYDIVLLDPDRLDQSGLGALNALRSARVPTPVLMILREADPDWKARALFSGADDILTLPIHQGELLARMAAIVRRSRGHASTRIEIGLLVVDTRAKIVQAHDRYLSLTAKEYVLLELLAMRKGSVVSRDTILDHLYGGRDEPEVEIINVYISRLRRKITEAGVDGRILHTAWGRGFTLLEPAVVAAAPKMAA